MIEAARRIAIGVDIGGTFTDVVCQDDSGAVRLVKIPTTRRNPSAGVKAAMDHMATDWAVDVRNTARFVHGTTVATNAVLEMKGAKIGLLATDGFKDVIEIGRQMRHAMYDLKLKPETPVFLAPRALRKDVRERIGASGEVLVPLDEDSLLQAVEELVAEDVEAIAVSFLFSFLNPAHERRARDVIIARHPGMMVSLSSEVDPAFREYERTCVTAFDAYIKPIVGRYLENMEQDLVHAGVETRLQIMQSRGGISSSVIARRRPVRLFLSGPAAGVIGGLEIGRAAGIEDLITVDVGGTSCDIALISRGQPLIRAEGDIGGYAVRMPMVDVNAIGSGGGSIAWIDGAGSLRVGPESAGSEPGPAAYGHGGERATVTDASIVLGYINPDYFAAGSLRLMPDLARKAIKERIADPLAMGIEEAALGIHRVLNAQMAEAIRLVSIGRGIDPRGYALLPLGGGGSLHATALARELGIRRIAVPPHPGVLSAMGLLFAPVEHEASAAFPRSLAGLVWSDVRAALDGLDRSCAALMRSEGIPPAAAEILYFADICYVGQSYYLEIALQAGAEDPLAALYRDFLVAHDRIYGHSTEGPTRIVNLRAVHRSDVDRPAASGIARPKGSAARKGERSILTADSGSFIAASIYDRASLPVGVEVHGPAILEQADTTTLIEPGWSASVIDNGTVIITRD